MLSITAPRERLEQIDATVQRSEQATGTPAGIDVLLQLVGAIQEVQVEIVMNVDTDSTEFELQLVSGFLARSREVLYHALKMRGYLGQEMGVLGKARTIVDQFATYRLIHGTVHTARAQGLPVPDARDLPQQLDEFVAALSRWAADIGDVVAKYAR